LRAKGSNMFGFGKKKSQQGKATQNNTAQAPKTIIVENERAAKLQELIQRNAFSIEQTHQIQGRALQRANERFKPQCGVARDNNIDARFMCPSAMENTKIVSFLLELGLNPYYQWNMFYFSFDKKLALITDSLVVVDDEEATAYTTTNGILSAIDKGMYSALEQAANTWGQAKSAFLQDGDINTLKSFQDFFKIQLATVSGKMERGVFRDRRGNLGLVVNSFMSEALKQS